jgi:archaellum biogenesis ATPase FlaH
VTPDQQRALDRAARAQRIIEDELVVDCLRKMDEEAVTRWRKAKVADEREDAWRDMKAVENFVRYFRAIMDQGRVSIDQIDRQKRQPFNGSPFG